MESLASTSAFHLFFEKYPHPILVLGTDSLRVVAANQAACSRYGYSAQEFLVLRFSDLCAEGEHASWLEVPRETGATTRTPIVIEQQRRDGSKFDARLTVLHAPETDPNLRFVMVNDQPESDLGRSEPVTGEMPVEDYRDLVESAADTVFTADAGGHFLSVNAAGERLTGYARGELLAMSVFDLLRPEWRDRGRRAMLGGTGAAIEVEIQTKSGKRLVMEMTLAKSVSRGQVEYRGIARDVTDRIQTARFAEGRRTILEMMTRGEAFVRVLSAICEVVEAQFEGVLCSIGLPRKGLADLVVWSAVWTDSEKTARTAGRTGSSPMMAHDEETGVSLSVVSDKSLFLNGRLPLSYRYAWTIEVGKAAERTAWLKVYRQNSAAPTEQEVAALRRAVDLARVAIEHDRLTSQLRHQATHDALTGLPNRLMFREHLSSAIHSAEKSGGAAGLISLDLDDFKLVNDSKGDLTGDKLLGKVAARLQEELGASALLARTGGDEFSILVKNIERVSDVVSVAKRLIVAMRKPFELAGRELFVSATCGISIYPLDGPTADSLIQCAGVALYRRKLEGKGGYKVYQPEMAETAARRQLIQNHLHRAAENTGEFALAFQPQADLSNGRLAGFESLLRWAPAGLGNISPAEFIPIAEESGLILRIGGWALQKVCDCASEWKQRSGKAPRIAVNVSAHQFDEAGFLDRVVDALKRSSLDPADLELELTETAVMRNFQHSAEKVAALRAMGIAVSIDDFGTGYSSLSYLEKLPVDKLKIDASFIRRIAPGHPAPTLVQAIIGLAHNFNMAVIAEGIETEYQMAVLRQMGCDMGQGYWIGEPLPEAVALETLLANQNTGIPRALHISLDPVRAA